MFYRIVESKLTKEGVLFLPELIRFPSAAKYSLDQSERNRQVVLSILFLSLLHLHLRMTTLTLLMWHKPSISSPFPFFIVVPSAYIELVQMLDFKLKDNLLAGDIGASG